jgi:hypothetical protein
MAASIFNLRVPVPGGQVFLWNTLTDAEVMVTGDVAALLDAPPRSLAPIDADTREALSTLTEHGFLTDGRDADRLALAQYLHTVTHDRSELHISNLTTLACNVGCGYCYQGDRIVENLYRIAPYVPIAIDGNIDPYDAASFSELLAFLRAQPFADRVRQVKATARSSRCAPAAASRFPLPRAATSPGRRATRAASKLLSSNARRSRRSRLQESPHDEES